MADNQEREVSIRVNMPETLRNRLKGKAALEGRTMTEALISLVEDYVADVDEESERGKKRK